MSYVKMGDVLAAPTNAPAPKPTKPKGLISGQKRFSAMRTAAPVATRMAPTRAPVKSRCPEDELYDRIEQMCVPNPNYRPPAPPPKIPDPKHEPEDIDEDGFSPAPDRTPAPTEVPDTDDSSPDGEQTVPKPAPPAPKPPSRTSPGGSGSPVPYPYPGTVPPPAPSIPGLAPFEMPMAVPQQQPKRSISPVLLVGGGAVLAYLLLRKR